MYFFFLFFYRECCGFSFLFRVMFSFYYRELLWKFFYFVDYQDMVFIEEVKSGEYRNYKKFEFMMNFMQILIIDILFIKDFVRLEYRYIFFYI